MDHSTACFHAVKGVCRGTLMFCSDADFWKWDSLSLLSVHNAQYEVALKASLTFTKLHLFLFMPHFLLFQCVKASVNTSGSCEPACSKHKLVVKKCFKNNSELATKTFNRRLYISHTQTVQQTL